MSQYLKKIGILYRLLFPSLHAKRVKRWKNDNGDKTLRLNYPSLNSETIVFDVGGYEGQWASDIFSAYQANVYIYEPVNEYFNKISERFKRNKSIKVYEFGLGGKDRNEVVNILADESSIFKESNIAQTQEIKIKDICSVMDSLNITEVELIKINIEGGEYELLERLIVSGYISKIKNLQIQFHDFIPEAENRMTTIQTALAKTHELTYQYKFVWENWKINENL